MHRICSLAAAILTCGISLQSLAMPVALTGLGGSYTPGATQTFQVSLPPIANLGSYNIDLLLTGASGTAGTDYFFDVAATIAASSGYVFASTANYFDAVNVDPPFTHRLTLSDFDLTGTNVVASVNDKVATVVIGTAAHFQGSLSLTVDTSGLILDTPDVVPTSVAGFAQIVGDTRAAGDYSLVAVPEPSTIVLVALAFVMGMSRPRGSTRSAARRAVARNTTAHLHGAEAAAAHR